MKGRAIFSVGTVRANRIPNCKFPTDKDAEFKKQKRGCAVEYTFSAYGIDIGTVLLKDTKNVILCATYVGTMLFFKTKLVREPSEIPWYNRKEKYVHR